MILHCVFCAVRPDVEPGAIHSVCDQLQTFATGLPGVLGFDHGPNIDVEAKSPDHPYGFVIRFADRASLDVYASHPQHIALGADLCALCVGGGDGIVVYDLKF